MKKIGLVGGTGPESTLMYYKELNTRIDRMTDGRAMPDVAIESVNFRRAWEYVERGQYDLLADYLAEKVNSLTAGGAEIVSLTAGTMHIVLDKIREQTKTELVSIPRAVCREAMKNGYHKIGLLDGIVKESTLKEFREIILKLRDRDGIEAVVLGCTELPMILNRDNCPVPCLDSVDIHINELIERAAAD